MKLRVPFWGTSLATIGLVLATTYIPNISTQHTLWAVFTIILGWALLIPFPARESSLVFKVPCKSAILFALATIMTMVYESAMDQSFQHNAVLIPCLGGFVISGCVTLYLDAKNWRLQC